jgi:regulator-associated protein of mTOR
MLAACSAGELLPQNPELPADVFTSCLTTPIHMSMLWFSTRPSPLVQVRQQLLEQIPGQLNNRKTIMGELNWIFTAITDTIAWNILPPDLFQRLFRQDLLVASSS